MNSFRTVPATIIPETLGKTVKAKKKEDIEFKRTINGLAPAAADINLAKEEPNHMKIPLNCKNALFLTLL